MRIFLSSMTVTALILSGCAPLIVADLASRAAVSMYEYGNKIEDKNSAIKDDASNSTNVIKSNLNECIERYNGGAPHSNAIKYCELALSGDGSGYFQVANMHEKGTGGAYQNKPYSLYLYKQCATKQPSVNNNVVACENKVKELEAAQAASIAPNSDSQASTAILYIYCTSLQRMVIEGKEACPDVAAQSAVIDTKALTETQ